MKKVQLNCVYGDTLPGVRNLDNSVADKLIDAGYAIEIADDMDDTSSDTKSLKAKLADSAKLIKALTEERDNAVTALELAKGVSDGTALELAKGVSDGTALELAKGVSDGTDNTAKN